MIITLRRRMVANGARNPTDQYPEEDVHVTILNAGSGLKARTDLLAGLRELSKRKIGPG